MSLTGSIIIYVLIWWIVFFSLLPVDVDRNKKNFVEGVDPGAPAVSYTHLTLPTILLV